MPNFTAGTSFTDGVTNDVTAAKLNALVADAVPTSSLSLNSTTGTISLFSSGTGTAATPAIQPASDTNTGIFFPAADTIAFSEGGAEAMRIDSNGRVGIGTSSPARLLTIDNATNPEIGLYTGGTERVKLSTGGSATSQLVVDLGGAERLRIDSSGNVGVGTASPSATLEIVGNQIIKNTSDDDGATQAALGIGRNTVAGDTFLALGTNQTNDYSFIQSQNAGNPTYYNLLLNPKGGNVLVGTTLSGARMVVKTDSATPTRGIALTTTDYNYTDTGTLLQLGFGSATGNTNCRISGFSAGITAYANLILNADGGEVICGSTTDNGAYNLQCNGTGVWGAGAYVNGSDSRIKEDIQPLASGLDVVEKLNPVTYKYKETWSSDQSIQSGFIAQELLTALDGQIYIDGVVQQGGTEGYYSVAYQNLIPVLAKAIQELKSENDTLKSRIEALEAA
jgi:hypothetical protein